jgi:hypothetical protein
MNQNAIKLVYGNGFKAGIQFMMDKIERQYEAGKPILANDNLYWLKGVKENLRDIMDDIEAEYNAEMAADKGENGKVEND